jgi:hypothetical protein
MLICKYFQKNNINIRIITETNTKTNKKTNIDKKYDITKIIIITTKLIESIAINMSKFFHDLNINTYIQYDLSEEECINSTENELYIFINTTMIMHDYFPKIFILYQLEQSTSNWFSKKYYNYINNSNYIWEFSIKNRLLYNDIPLNQINYQMTPYYLNNIPSNNIEYDVFFYGATNVRRQKILNKISEIYNLKIGFGIIGDEKYDIISKSKIILNIHYYDDCSLEACRINEILQYNKVIISEKPSVNDWYNQSLYENIVEFVDVINDDLSNINNIINKIKYYLNEDNYIKKINQIKYYKIILHDKSKFNLYKNLFNIMNFSNYLLEYDLQDNKIYCLHLIETPKRIREFKKINNFTNIEIFPAIKYNPSWKGCALSYLNLIYNAKRCNLDTITICEDDCRFPDNFNYIYKTTREFLSKINWDIFVGVIADLPEDVSIINIYMYKNIRFIEINKMHSMVFNIYNKSIYDLIINWKKNTNDSNDSNDQIDQYIKNNNVRVITTYPFYFDCINVDSTIWGGNLYTHYNNMFLKSLNILYDKINKFNKNTIYIY